MINWQNKLRFVVLASMLTATPASFRVLSAREAVDVAPHEDDATVEASEGQLDLDEALRLKIGAKGLRDLNKVIQRLETALDKGLEQEDHDFAEQMLSDSLMERATTLMRVINTRSIDDKRVQQIRQLVTSDLRDVIAYGEPPAVAYLMLGKLQTLAGGDAREARRAISNYLKIKELPDAQRAEGLVLRARMVRDLTKSIDYIEQAIKLAPENADYRYARATLLRRTKKLDQALEVLATVIEMKPENATAVIAQGEIYRQQEKIEAAIASFDKATELAPKAASPYQNRGEIYRNQNKYDEAIEQFSEVLKLQPNVLLTLLHRADTYLASGKLEEALIDIEAVLKQKGLVAAHRLHAEILRKLGRLDEEILEMETVSAAMPEKPEFKMRLAIYHLAGKQYSKAIEDYTEVLDQQADNFMALQARGDVFLNVGKHAEAIVDFSRAVKLQAKDAALLNNLAWVLATSPEKDLRDGKRAVELATLACELTKEKLPHILSTLAAAHAEAGDFEKAIKRAQQAVDLNDPQHTPQITKELESYREGKPWREKQNLKDESLEAPLENSLQEPPTDVRAPTYEEQKIELELDEETLNPTINNAIKDTIETE